MTTPRITLRDRRRQQTAREIHNATLLLVNERGLDAVTTEMIAKRAGISLRTFFNYFPNKEAAIVGPSSGIDPDILAEFAGKNGSLIEDFGTLIAIQLERSPLRKDAIQAIHKVIDASPSLETAFARSFEAMTTEIATALSVRKPTEAHHINAFLASVLMKALANASITWAHDAETTEQGMAEMTRCLLETLLRDLCPPAPRDLE